MNINLGPWLRIAHCSIFSAFTIPEVITLEHTIYFYTAAVTEALGVPRNLKVSPKSISNYYWLGLAFKFYFTRAPPHRFRLLFGAEQLWLLKVYSWWCPSVNSFKFQPCDHTPPRTQRLWFLVRCRATHKNWGRPIPSRHSLLLRLQRYLIVFDPLTFVLD